MLYVEVRNKENVPAFGWEEPEYLFKKLRSMTYIYSWRWHRKMFATAGAEFRVEIVKWGGSRGVSQRQVVGEFTEPAHLAACLRMLIVVAEDEAKQEPVMRFFK